MTDFKNISAVFQGLFKEMGIEKPMEQHKAVNYWAEVVGARVAEISEAEKIENGILTVKVKTPVWRNELVFLKTDIIKKLNTVLKKNVVKDIKFT